MINNSHIRHSLVASGSQIGSNPSMIARAIWILTAFVPCQMITQCLSDVSLASYARSVTIYDVGGMLNWRHTQSQSPTSENLQHENL